MEKDKTFNHVKRVNGYLREVPEDAKDTRLVSFTISTEQRDRHGTILDLSGWDLKNYKNNPIVGYQHNVYGDNWFTDPDPKYIIGVGEVYADEKTKSLIGDVRFEPEAVNPFAEQIFQKVMFGSLRATSVGFLPRTKGHWGEGDEAADGKNPVFYYGKRDLLEFSVVNVPSNPGALKRSLEEQKEWLYDIIREALGEQFTPEVINKMTIGELVSERDGEDNGERQTMSDFMMKMDLDILKLSE